MSQKSQDDQGKLWAGEDTESILSRRRFLVKSVLAGAAVALCVTESACPCLSPREPDPDEEVEEKSVKEENSP